MRKVVLRTSARRPLNVAKNMMKKMIQVTFVRISEHWPQSQRIRTALRPWDPTRALDSRFRPPGESNKSKTNSWLRVTSAILYANCTTKLSRENYYNPPALFSLGPTYAFLTQLLAFVFSRKAIYRGFT